jgi:hypothetical protein
MDWYVRDYGTTIPVNVGQNMAIRVGHMWKKADVLNHPVLDFCEEFSA